MKRSGEMILYIVNAIPSDLVSSVSDVKYSARRQQLTEVQVRSESVNQQSSVLRSTIFEQCLDDVIAGAIQDQPRAQGQQQRDDRTPVLSR